MYNNLKAFEYAKEIVVAKMSNTNISPTKEGGENVAEFFETIFNKLVELNDLAHKPKND